MEGGEVVHDVAEHVPPPILQGHALQIVLERVDGVHVELRLPPGELVQGEVAVVLVNIILMRSILLLIDLKYNQDFNHNS